MSRLLPLRQPLLASPSDSSSQGLAVAVVPDSGSGPEPVPLPQQAQPHHDNDAGAAGAGTQAAEAAVARRANRDASLEEPDEHNGLLERQLEEASTDSAAAAFASSHSQQQHVAFAIAIAVAILLLVFLIVLHQDRSSCSDRTAAIGLHDALFSRSAGRGRTGTGYINRVEVQLVLSASRCRALLSVPGSPSVPGALDPRQWQFLRGGGGGGGAVCDVYVDDGDSGEPTPTRTLQDSHRRTSLPSQRPPLPVRDIQAITHSQPTHDTAATQALVAASSCSTQRATQHRTANRRAHS